MSLREEIKELIKDCKLNRNPNLDWYTDEILSKIEKRIDERMDVVNQEYFAFHSQLTARKDELEKVKEVLK